jgi:hypothetical protein
MKLLPLLTMFTLFFAASCGHQRGSHCQKKMKACCQKTEEMKSCCKKKGEEKPKDCKDGSCAKPEAKQEA